MIASQVEWLKQTESKIWRDAILAGLGGTIGGWALFLLWAEEHSHLWTWLLGLGTAAIAGCVLEHLRDVASAGHGELDRKTIRAVLVGLVMLVITVELFTEAAENVAKLSYLLPSVLAALVGEDLYQAAVKASIPIWWTLIGLVGIWAYSGVVLACWLCALIIHLAQKNSARAKIAFGVLHGTLGGLLGALATPFSLLAFLLFLMLADAATFEDAVQGIESHLPYAVTRLLLMPLRYLMWIWHGLLDLFGIIGLDHLGAWRVAPALLGAGVFLMIGWGMLDWVSEKLFQRWSYSDSMSVSGWGVYWMIAFGVLLVGPLLAKRPKEFAELFLLSAVIWMVPGAVLGGLLPFLQRQAQSPGLWLGMALLGGGLVLLAVWMRDQQWFWLLCSASLIAVAVVSFLSRGWANRPRGEMWPLYALAVPLLMCGPVAIRQEVSYRLLGDLHTLMSVQPIASAREVTAYELHYYPGRGFGPWQPLTGCELSDQLQKWSCELSDQLQKLHRAEQAVGRIDIAPAEKRTRRFLKRAESDQTAEKLAEKKPTGEHKELSLLDSIGTLQSTVRQGQVLRLAIEDVESTLAKTRREKPWTKSFFWADQEATIREVEEVLAQTQAALAAAKQLEPRVARASELAVAVSPRLALVLELCVSGSFGYWVTLACLAAWARLQTPETSTGKCS